jgi:hypothetical protein
MTTGVPRQNRHVRGHPCPVCGGFDEAPRGQGKRCSGFTSDDGLWCRCTREEHAGRLEIGDGDPPTYRHMMRGACRCGVEHGPAIASYGEIEATYDYRDEAGNLLYQVVRKAGKKFLQRRPDPSSPGGWAWKLGDTRRVLYRLPELLEAPTDQTVYIVEGEKDVATLVSRGLVATCNAGGAGKWHTVSGVASTVLRGRTVVVIADADDPGRRHARQVHDALSAHATVSCWESPAPCKDVSDLLGPVHGGTLDALVPMPMPVFVAAPPAPTPPAWLDHEPVAPQDDDPRPEVRLTVDSYKNVTALDAALAEHDPDVFQRGFQLVEVLAERKPGLVPIGAPTLRALNKHSLETRVAQRLRCVRFQPPDKKAIALADTLGNRAQGEWVPTRANAETAIMPMLAFGRWDRIRPLTGITESPIFRPDGTICQTPGYDEATGYLYRPSCEYPPVPSEPTQQDARLALESLRHVFCDFPYVNEAMSYVPIAAILTILARAAISGTVPVFAFEASIQGSGKTMQGDCAHIIATGRMAAKSSFPHDEDEQRKTVLSAAVSASPVAFFDNVKGEFGGAPIEGVITTGELRQRVLGRTEDISVPWIATVLVTGNNMTMTEDMLRRSLFCRIEPDSEDPTKRTSFQHEDLPTWTLAERPRLMVAALTILRSFACHGYPDAGLGTMQSFYAWSKLIPNAIAYAGGPNVLECIGTTEKGASDEFASLATLVRELPRLAQKPLRVKEILDLIYPAPRREEPPDGWEELREAIESLSAAKGGFPPDPIRFGKALKAREGQVHGGLRLSSEADKHTKARFWYVRKVSSP